MGWPDAARESRLGDSWTPQASPTAPIRVFATRQWNRSSIVGQQIEKLARFAAETQLEDIPAPVREHAKRALLDTLGVILGGSVRPEVVALRNRLANNSTGAT